MPDIASATINALTLLRDQLKEATDIDSYDFLWDKLEHIERIHSEFLSYETLMDTFDEKDLFYFHKKEIRTLVDEIREISTPRNLGDLALNLYNLGFFTAMNNLIYDGEAITKARNAFSIYTRFIKTEENIEVDPLVCDLIEDLGAIVRRGIGAK